MEHKTRTDFLASIDADEYTNKVYNEMQEEMMFRIFLHIKEQYLQFKQNLIQLRDHIIRINLRRLISIPLSQRVFQEGSFSEDRDVKSAKIILALGLYNQNLTRKELMGLPEEERISIFQKFYAFEKQILPMNREATAL